MTRPLPAEVPVDALPGVGPARAERLARLEVHTVEDLLLLVPRRVDVAVPLDDVRRLEQYVGGRVSVRGRLGPPSLLRRGGRRSLTKARLSTPKGAVDALWFNQPWVRARIVELVEADGCVELLGPVVRTRSGFALASPRLRPAAAGEPLAELREPVYPTAAGLGQELLRGLVGVALEEYGAGLVDPLPEELLRELELPTLGAALRALHTCAEPEAADRARRRLALEDALCLQARVLRGASARARREGRAPVVALGPGDRHELLAALPHEPTRAQLRATAEILDDLASPVPMRRLLQGDVGSGKTLVAAAAALGVAKAGLQAALLAPTALLAEQHAAELEPLFAAAGRRVVLLTGSLPGPARRSAEQAAASGEADLVVGTHALFSERVRYRHLALAVVDEQQRFGVAAKRDLLEKGAGVHALLVTATPIPRTLALSLYGELDLSVLDELPPGRRGVTTRVLEPDRRGHALAHVEQRLEAGERVFWVCPRISESDADEAAPDRDVASAERAYRGLSRGSLGRHGVVLVHGALVPSERAERLARFRAGDARLLVGTSVVEVGLDVPEATVVVVEDAERMGLSQLHQLRGRVGRGGLPGTCLLLVAKGAGRRLAVLEQTGDGFRIAEEDLARRGAGELAGSSQAGGVEQWEDDWGGDLALFVRARRLLQERPDLQARFAARRGRAGEVALV